MAKATKALNLRIPAELHTFLKKLCIETEFTQRDIFVMYLLYLKKNYHPNRKTRLIDDTTDPKTFKLSDQQPD